MTRQRTMFTDGSQIAGEFASQPTPVLGSHLKEGHGLQLACLEGIQGIWQQAASQPEAGTVQQFGVRIVHDRITSGNGYPKRDMPLPKEQASHPGGRRDIA